MTRRFTNATRETFSSLKHRNFQLFFAGQGISQVGNWLTLIAQTLLVLKLTGSGVMVGLLTACQFAPVLLFGAWAGLIADRYDKRKLLITVQVFAMAQSFALAVLAFSHKPAVWAIFIVAGVGGLTMAFDNPARRAYVVEMVPESDVNNAVSLNSALMTSSRIIGPTLAGLLIHTAGYGWCFTVDGLSYIAVLIGYGLMKPNTFRAAPKTQKGKKQIRAGFNYARSVPDLWIPLVMMAVVGTLSFNFQVVMPLFVERTFHGNTGTFTLLFSTVAVGSLIGALATARRKVINVSNVVFESAAFGIAMLVFAASPTLVSSFPLGVIVGCFSIAFMTASTAIVQVRSAPEMRGRVLALQAIVFLGSTPIGGPILGAICDWLGARAGIVVGGLAALGAAVWGHAAAKRKVVDPESTVERVPVSDPELQTA
jgi:MFS family permease